MSYHISHIARILNAQGGITNDTIIEHLLIDSRKTYFPQSSLFFALKGPRRNGHQFIHELYNKGVLNFVVSEEVDHNAYPDANFLRVSDTLDALQQLAIHHRQRFKLPVIGITGSNGKTIVKEWLYQLMQEDQHIIRSPKSYNSQIGVPLSVWPINEQHTLGIFEAGISRAGEMSNLARIIQPTIGVLTNIGEAHSEGFSSVNEKATEKMKLFIRCNIIVYSKDNTEQFNPELSHVAAYRRDHVSFYSWSKFSSAWLNIRSIDKLADHTVIQGMKESEHISIQIPFTDDASIENAITCWCVMLVMGYPNEVIRHRMLRLSHVNMRLEMKKGINHCSIINDSYSADISSLEIALNFLEQQSAGTKKTVILSDLLQTSAPDRELYGFILNRLRKHKVTRLIGIGNKITKELSQRTGEGEMQVELFETTDEFIRQFLTSHFREETILVKGARLFEFERIVQLLEQKIHQTVLEIDLNAAVHNLKEYQRYLNRQTKIMAMVKAFAYGSGGSEIAGVLQYHGVDYLGVAYADEGVELRRSGIHLPIMVMNAEPNTFESLVNFQLEPDIYSFTLLQQFDEFLKQEGMEQYGIHLELETGMNRLGFNVKEINRLALQLRSTNSFRVRSVFTHLVASEDKKEDAFTKKQFELFNEACDELALTIQHPFLRHISNSAAILRDETMQLDMVRLGIGLYGIDTGATGKVKLIPVATLRTTVAQLKQVNKGETVSYNRKGKIKRDSVIATVRIGYADGYNRRLGHGKGKMLVRGQLAPVIGTVCMDMTMLDVTDIKGVKEGDEVIVFGKKLPIEQVAEWAETIPYEIMTGVSQRVKRLYYEE